MNEPILPSRMEDLLSDDAETIDSASRAMLDYLQSYGYRLVITPLTESISSLLSGDTYGNLSKRTLRLTDPLGGNPIGIRADITAQVSRMDRQHFGTEVVRLCYCGPTIYSRPTKPWLSREQLQIGAELFGDSSLSADTEIVMLALESLEKAQISDLTVAVGHAALSEQLLTDIDPVVAQRVRRALVKRDRSAIRDMQKILAQSYQALFELTHMQGEREQLKAWRDAFPSHECFAKFFAELDEFCDRIEKSQYNYTIDLASVSGYQYHSGIVFTILSGETIVAQGGKYGSDDRPATGFSADLRTMLSKLPKPVKMRCFASKRAYTNSDWHTAVAKLLAQGWCCILVNDWQDIPDSCTHRLICANNHWQLQES